MEKIAWIKYSNSIELGVHLNYTAGTTDLRTRLLKELINNGVEVNFHTRLTKESVNYLNSSEGKNYFKKSEKIKMRINEQIDQDVDFLLVESGPDNAMFNSDYNGEKIPSVALTNHLVSKYKGLCIYLQIDLALPFVFYPEFFSKKFYRESIKWGDSTTLFKDKSWLVVTPAKNTEVVIQKIMTARSPYNLLDKYGLVKFDRYEFHYCGIDFNEEPFEIQKQAKNLVYVGGERNRTKKFDKLYNQAIEEDLDVIVYGKWKPDTIKKFPKVKWGGVLGRGMNRKAYNDAFGSVIIGDVNYEKVGIVSGRFFEVITAGSLPLIDKDLVDTTVSDVLDEDLVKFLTVECPEDVTFLYNSLVGSQERIDLINTCIENVKRFSPKTSFDLLKDLYQKYKGLKKTNMEDLSNCTAEIIENRINKHKGVIDELTEMVLQ